MDKLLLLQSKVTEDNLCEPEIVKLSQEVDEIMVEEQKKKIYLNLAVKR